MWTTHPSLTILITIILNAQNLHSFSIPSSLLLHQQRHSVPTPSSPKKTSLRGGTDDYNDYDDAPYRSIGEVVGGLHGGKYQFGPTGGGGPGSAFSGSGSRRSSTCEEEEDLPNWAERMGPPPPDAKPFETIRLPPVNDDSDPNPTGGKTVSVRNDERTWEKYYAKILLRPTKSTLEPYSSGPFRVVPSSGFLAPRGGASNACDARKPYSDAATLCVSRSEGGVVEEGEEWWLVVGTEEEKWWFRLEEEV